MSIFGSRFGGKAEALKYDWKTLDNLEQLEELRAVLHAELGEEWTWEREAVDDQYRPISRVYTTLPDVSIFREADWPRIITFLRERLVALDEFWSSARYHFEAFKEF